MSGSDLDRSECTDKACTGEAKYALWMGDQFSRVLDAHETMPYGDGDLHPYVCETCLPRYERLHGDKGEFVRPGEKLVADGGTDQCPNCGSPAWIIQNPVKEQTECQRCREVLGRSVNPRIAQEGGDTDASHE